MPGAPCGDGLELNTAVLRLCYFLGPSRGGTLAGFLSKSRVPVRCSASTRSINSCTNGTQKRRSPWRWRKQLRGVFNVAGPSPVPLSTVCEATGRRAVAIPGPLYPSVLGRFGFPYLPDDAIAHVKYPIVIDNTAFVEATGFEPRYTAKQTMEGFRWN